MELNDIRKNICLGKAEVSVERILVIKSFYSVYKVIENLVEYGSTKFSMTILSAILLHQ